MVSFEIWTLLLVKNETLVQARPSWGLKPHTKYKRIHASLGLGPSRMRVFLVAVRLYMMRQWLCLDDLATVGIAPWAIRRLAKSFKHVEYVVKRVPTHGVLTVLHYICNTYYSYCRVITKPSQTADPFGNLLGPLSLTASRFCSTIVNYIYIYTYIHIYIYIFIYIYIYIYFFFGGGSS